MQFSAPKWDTCCNTFHLCLGLSSSFPCFLGKESDNGVSPLHGHFPFQYKWFPVQGRVFYAHFIWSKKKKDIIIFLNVGPFLVLYQLYPVSKVPLMCKNEEEHALKFTQGQKYATILWSVTLALASFHSGDRLFWTLLLLPRLGFHRRLGVPSAQLVLLRLVTLSVIPKINLACPHKHVWEPLTEDKGERGLY